MKNEYNYKIDGERHPGLGLSIYLILSIIIAVFLSMNNVI